MYLLYGVHFKTFNGQELKAVEILGSFSVDIIQKCKVQYMHVYIPVFPSEKSLINDGLGIMFSLRKHAHAIYSNISRL